MTPFPDTEMPDAPFWQGARDHRLVFQHCSDCGFVRWPAAGVCPECLSREYRWVEVAATGTVWSIVVYHRAYARTGIPPVPYNVALVELDCGVRLLTRIVDADPSDAGPGTRVAVQFQAGEDGVVPVFSPITP
jgi:uncharacterized OB-fold protein